VYFPPPPPPPGDRAKSAPAQWDVHGYVLECLEKGSTPSEVRKQLIARGHSANEANAVVDSVAHWRKGHYVGEGIDLDDPDSIRAAGKRNMVIGAGICLIGLVITIGTFALASGSGGSFIVASGAIFWGFVQFCRGAAQAGSGRLQ
jgi:hypothetical protein